MVSEGSAQRRLAAILVADVDGYSRLMEADEAGTLTSLVDRRKGIVEPVVKQHSGRIVKFMGDSVLVEFASAVNAVAGALQLQACMAKANDTVPEARHITLRIGINIGDVLGKGSDIYGDGVNIAARLEPLADPGGVCISAGVYDAIRGKIAVAAEDLGEKQLKNIERPIRVFRLSEGSSTATASVSAGPEKSKPSIAVIPFANMSRDIDQEFFADGITEDIITELSRFRDLFVIARNSSFTYKGKAVKITEVARDLGVGYVLEGSVRRAGNRVRITAQLIDGGTGSHIWADRYDRELGDMFAVQDEITQKIVGMLALGLKDDALERAGRKHPENLVAYEHWLRGKRWLWTVGQHNLDARRHFEKAAIIDPTFSRAYSGLALTYQMEALDFPLASEATAAYESAYITATKAIELDEADHQAHISLAWSLLYRHDYEGMKKHIDRALQLNPNDADTLANAVYLLTMYGEPDRAVSCGEAAVALNPRHPDWYLSFLASALFSAKRFPEALELRRKVPMVFVDTPFAYAALLSHMNELDEARKWGEIAVASLKSRPMGHQISEKGCINVVLENNPYRRGEDRMLFAEGMRKAGIPG